MLILVKVYRKPANDLEGSVWWLQQKKSCHKGQVTINILYSKICTKFEEKKKEEKTKLIWLLYIYMIQIQKMSLPAYFLPWRLIVTFIGMNMVQCGQRIVPYLLFPPRIKKTLFPCSREQQLHLFYSSRKSDTTPPLMRRDIGPTSVAAVEHHI